MIQKLNFKPGVVREATEYAASGGWYDADKVRFRAGFPEKIGGWIRVSNENFQGTCRYLHEWSSLEFDRYVGLGTHMKLYILWGNSFYDITPIRKENPTLPANPFTVIADPSTIQVNVPSHGPAGIGDFVRFSGVTGNVGGFTPADLNQEFQITGVPDGNTIIIEAKRDPAGDWVGSIGGGSAVSATFQIPIGLDVAIIGMGWGVPPWGGTTKFITYKTNWGERFDPRELSPLGAEVTQIRLWNLDNFGEDLVANIRGGPIFYWHEGMGLSKPAVDLSTPVNVNGVNFVPNQVPTVAAQAIVSPNDRHLIALGCNDAGSTTRDPVLVRWSSEEDAYDWEPRRDNSAGGQRLSLGSYIITGLRTRQEILVWTDLGLWSMKYIGAPYVYGFDVVAEGLSILGPNAAINAGNVVFWMDRGIFYTYTGQVQELPCTLKDYVFSDLNYRQGYKVYAGHNHSFSEVTWYYPSAKSDEIDRYVTYNYVDQLWVPGSMDRTSWLDMGRASYPIATAQGVLYYHEYGEDAGGAPLVAYIESADMDQDGGNKFLFLRRLIPDVQFRGANQQQSLGVSILTRSNALEPKQVTRRLTVSRLTGELYLRTRARQISLRFESSEKGMGWRLGTQRVDMQPDGDR